MYFEYEVISLSFKFDLQFYFIFSPFGSTIICLQSLKLSGCVLSPLRGSIIASCIQAQTNCLDQFFCWSHTSPPPSPIVSGYFSFSLSLSLSLNNQLFIMYQLVCLACV